MQYSIFGCLAGGGRGLLFDEKRAELEGNRAVAEEGCGRRVNLGQSRVVAAIYLADWPPTRSYIPWPVNAKA